ncbi:carbonic anhydrase [Paraclostridium ghonii]|uniref:beta-class carbonic anhydrase n=1 Tax=Paraclostridium ghonii TaxID=29358 RepID=UPI00202CE1AD|nr:carbonic anhydrase [Paeniclostridium ghonii]MCM0168056.1 carbonic anhydrase [Paeniclostridium ghonii]
MSNENRKLDKILDFNKSFINNKEYTKYETSKNPDKKIVILSCMDTRLTDLLPKSMNLKNGDAKIIKNAGATVVHPFGSIMRSIIVAIYEFEVDEVLIVGHDGCGMCNLNTENLINKIIDKGIPSETMDIISNSGIDIEKWLHGFESVEDSIIDSVEMIKKHPLTPKDMIVHGLVMCPNTGKISVVVDGYKNK